MSASVLVVDDDAGLRETLVEFFGTFLWTVAGAGSAAEARAALARHTPDVVLLDLRLPDADGLAFLDELRRGWPDLSVVVLSGTADVRAAVRAMQRGAVDLLEKPVDLDVLASTIRRATALGRLHREVEVRRARPHDPAAPGTLPRPAAVEAAIALAAHTDAPVLITGPVGSGRAAVARAVHDASGRAAAAFVDVVLDGQEAAAIEQELFGREGTAVRGGGARRGLVELAADGTLLLDGADRTPGPLAAKLLRLLDDRAFRRVEGATTLRTDVRVIGTAGLDSDTEPAVERLLAALAVVRIALPPLASRQGELPALVAALLPAGAALEPAAWAALAAHDWPGDVRELRQVLWRASLVARGGAITTAMLALPTRGPTPAPALGPAPRPLAELEREAILAALAQTGGNRTAAARLLGIARSTLHARLAGEPPSDSRTPGNR